MKYILITLLFFYSLIAYSAYQFNTKGNQSWLTFDSNTILSLEAYRSGKDKDHENFIDKGNGIQDYGWYNLNTNEYGSFKDNASFTFTENDKISLWIKDEEGNVYNSTKNVKDFTWGKSDIENDIFKIYGGNKGSNGTHEYYTFTINTITNSNSNTPTGQPLPGIIATLLIGGTSIFYIKNRKKYLNK